jgi:hypothetical protein
MTTANSVSEIVKKTGLITCYGIRWRREFASFGSRGPGNAGSLKGYRLDDKNKNSVNMWSQTGVYALYDGPELVYIGRAVDGSHSLGTRLRQHHSNARKADRWTAFSWLGFRSVNGNGQLQAERLPKRQISARDTAVIMDGIIIEFLNPRLNNRGGDLSTIPLYNQVRLEKE